eukprot:gene16079-11503_t
MMIVNFRDNFIAHWIDTFPTHDILISSEYHAETGIANTGSIILKNSEWSRHFLRRWWGEDHRRGHDQILFNVLYQSLATTTTALEDLQSHIKLLPIRALNSLPPAYLTFSRDDSVLHLMGERGDYRRAVFRAAEAAISRRLTENEGKMDFHVADVGIDRAFLAEQLVTIMEQRIPLLLQTMNASSSPPPNHHHHHQPLCFDPHPIVYLSETTQEFRELSLQYGELVSTRASGLTAVSKRIAWLEAAIRSWQTWYDAFLTCYPPLMMAQYSTSSNHHSLSMTHTRLWVDVLNTLSLLENDWLTEVSTATARWEQIEQTYAKVTRQLLLLVSWVQPGVSQRQVWSMIATLWQNQALVTAQRAVGTTDSSDRVVVTPSSLSGGTTFESGNNLPASSFFAIAVDLLHQVLDVYTRYLVGPFVPEDRWQPVSTWVEEHNSYRYRLARVYQQLGDVYCAMKAAAVGVGVGVDDGDEVARASGAYGAAVQLWEDLLHLPSSSSSLTSMHDTTSTPTPSGDWQWQEDHHEYWQTIQHALQCLRLVGRVEPADKEDPSHFHHHHHQQQQRRQFFTQKLLVLRSLFPTVPMTMAPTPAPRPVKTKTSAPEQPIAPVVDSTSAVDQSMTTTSTATTSTQHPQSQQQKRRF